MESVTTTMHVSEPQTICSTLSCTDNDNDDLTKKLEDELLYGTGDDGDEEDALSDDSLRLRLSDDEADGDDSGASCPSNNHLENSEKTEPFDADVQTSIDSSNKHLNNSNGINSGTSLQNGIDKHRLENDFTDDHAVAINNFCDTGEKNEFDIGTHPINQAPLFNQYIRIINRNKRIFILSALRKHPYHPNYLINSYKFNNDFSEFNIYGIKFHDHNYPHGQYQHDKSNKYSRTLDSLLLKRPYNPIVKLPNKKSSTDIGLLREGSNSQTRVSATTKKSSQTDDSTPGINNYQLNSCDNKDTNTNSIDDITKTTEIELSNMKSNITSDIVPPSDVTITNVHVIKTDAIANELIKEQDNSEDITDVPSAVEPPINDKSIDNVASNEPTLSNPMEPETKITSDSQKPIELECQKSDENTKQLEVEISKTTDSDTTSATSTTNNLPKDQLPNQNETVSTPDVDSPVAPSTSVCESTKAIINLEEAHKRQIQEKEISTDNEIDDIPKDKAISDSINDIIKKVTVKRPLSDSEEEGLVNKKIACQEIIRSDNTTLDEETISIEVIEMSNESVDLKKVKHKEDDIPKLVNGEALNTVNAEMMSPELPMPALSIEALNKNTESQLQEVNILDRAPLEHHHDLTSKGKRKRRRRKVQSPVDTVIGQGQEKENVRVRRETAQKAEEIIRKKFLHDDSDSDISDNATTYVKWNKSSANNARAASPPSLKRNCHDDDEDNDDDDDDEPVITNALKKPKKDVEPRMSTGKNETIEADTKSGLGYVRKFFLRDAKQNLVKPTQEELEELLIQKVIETITMRDEIGKLREQAKISERNLDATRVKFQQLSKQVKDFEMVLARLNADRRGNDKNAPPIKINRSVGLQVNFLSEQGVKNLRQLQQTQKQTPSMSVNGVGTSSAKQPDELPNSLGNGRKGLKVRSPRRSDLSITPSPIVPKTATAPPQIQVQQPITQPTPALGVSKAPETRHSVGSTGQIINQQLITNQSITLNGNVTLNPPRQAKVLNVRSNNNNENLIDLTGEEEKSKTITNPPPLTVITSPAKDTSTPVPKPAPHPTRYQRVHQSTTPAPTNIPQQPIRVVKPSPSDKPTPTAIVNNLNAPRLAFVMQGNGAGPRQLVITSNANQIRPAVTTNSRGSFTYNGVQTLANGPVRVVSTTSTSVAAQKVKHPAPLPVTPTYPLNIAWKHPPPAPSLKISKVAHGIVLSWNMALSDRYADIASYQLYAYQEITGVPPNSAQWKKVGDVRALPLPMACTLTQFSEGNNYYFAVRAVDTHSRLGQYSPPGNISL